MTNKTRNIVNRGTLGPTGGERPGGAQHYSASGVKVITGAAAPGRQVVNHAEKVNRGSFHSNMGTSARAHRFPGRRP